MDRRRALMAVGALGLTAARARPRPRRLDLIEAPTNLGLRPGPRGKLAGTRRAPAVLDAAGLSKALRFGRRLSIAALPYSRDPQPGTRIRNGLSLHRFNTDLAQAVQSSLAGGGFPLVIGGDCSNLLGAMAGLRRAGGRGLIHLDGHSDFFHPGNYDAAARPGSAAGMDLALITGRGEPLLTRWPGVAGPLAEDADVLQIGERERNDPGYPFHEIERLAMARAPIEDFKRWGVAGTLRFASAWLVRRNLTRVWLHLDLDILDQTVMPAVDSPGSPGLSYQELAALVRSLIATGRIAGADVAIYDPDLDPTGRYASEIVAALAAGFGGLG